MPVVGRTDETDIEVLLLEHFAVVTKQPRTLFRFLPLRSDVCGLFKLLLIHVAERYDLDRRDLDQPKQVTFAIPAAADESDAFGLLVGDFLSEEFSLFRGGDSGTESRSRGGDELAAVHGEAPGEMRSAQCRARSRDKAAALPHIMAQRLMSGIHAAASPVH